MVLKEYWATVMSLELCLLVFVLSQRQSSFSMYLDALTDLVPWVFALDHTNCDRWIPVHIRDIIELQTRHPDVAREFNAGNFTIQKTNRIFSAIPIDQAHGHEVAALIEEFGDAHQLIGRRDEVLHHDQTASEQNAFSKNVCSLVNLTERTGQPIRRGERTPACP